MPYTTHPLLLVLGEAGAHCLGQLLHDLLLQRRTAIRLATVVQAGVICQDARLTITSLIAQKERNTGIEEQPIPKGGDAVGLHQPAPYRTWTASRSESVSFGAFVWSVASLLSDS
eukprot:SAG11_NODE_189_length_13028_cov_14.222446_8_plen_115_part_00